MKVDFNLITPEFKSKIETLLERCKDQGVIMVPYEGNRNVFVQATYWKQGRSQQEIEEKINFLKHNKAFFLADCLAQADTHIDKTEIITNAIPGLSWHQWGEALDCFWFTNGKPNWELDFLVDKKNGYTIYACEAVALGLDAGLFWKSFIDGSHIQFRKEGSPLTIFTLKEIDIAMQVRFDS